MMITNYESFDIFRPQSPNATTIARMLCQRRMCEGQTVHQFYLRESMCSKRTLWKKFIMSRGQSQPSMQMPNKLQGRS